MQEGLKPFHYLSYSTSASARSLYVMAMGSDAAEAALGLLGLTGSIDFRTSPTIPLKRKPSTTFSITPNDHRDPPESANPTETISCICGFTYDDGFSIACDDCNRWVHAACFDINDGGEVPEECRCWVCQPRKVDRERANRVQRSRQKQMLEAQGDRHKRRVSSPGVDRKRRVSAAAIDGSVNSGKRKRRYSANVGGQQSFLQQHDRPPPTPQQSHFQPPGLEDEHVEIDEPATHSYVHIEQDVVPHQYTRDKLKRLAQHWRGVTALNALNGDPATPSTPQTSLHPLPRSTFSHPTLSSNLNPLVRPPSYTVRTTQPIPSSALIAPYTSTIIPSTVYLSDPLNSYAHLGMPKPFVHLMGPPLDLALDARLAGNGARFVRSGCRPNAVLRPMLCKQAKAADPRGPATPDDTLTFGVFALRDLKAHEEIVLGWEWDDGSVIHQLPALINSPHAFAYVFPHLFQSYSTHPLLARRPHHVEQFRYQMTSMLHALSSTFTTCACGAKTRDCALNCLAEFVDGQMPLTPAPSPPSHHHEEGLQDGHVRMGGRAAEADLGPLIGVERGFLTKERVPMSGGMSGVEMVAPSSGWRWRSVSSSEQSPVAGPSKLPTVNGTGLQKATGKKDWKGKARASEDDMDVDVSTPASEGGDSMHRTFPSPSLYLVALNCSLGETRPIRRNGATKKVAVVTSPSPPPRSQTLPVPQIAPQNEALLPPKLRKKWIHQHTPPQPPKPPEHLRHLSPPQPSVVPMEVEEPADGKHSTLVGFDLVDPPTFPDAKMMPPPPLPPTNPSGPRFPNDPISPSTSFANLSLASPLVNGSEHSSAYFDIVRGGIIRSSSPTPGARTWEQTVLGLSIHRRSDTAPPSQAASPKSTSLSLSAPELTAGTDPPRQPSPPSQPRQESPPALTPSIQVHAPPVTEQADDALQETAEEKAEPIEAPEPLEVRHAQDVQLVSAEASPTITTPSTLR